MSRMSDMTVDEAMELVDEIVALADDVPDRGADFAESVREKSLSIGETIERTDRVTEAQAEALENMRNGLLRWMD